MDKVKKTFSLEKNTIAKIQSISDVEKRTLSSVIDISVNHYFNTKTKPIKGE